MNRTSPNHSRSPEGRLLPFDRPGPAEGILAGAIFGFFDSLLLFWTGTRLPLAYRALVFPSSLLVSTIVGLGLAFLGVLLGWCGFGRWREGWARAAPFVLLAGTLALLASRSEPAASVLPPAVMASLRWGVPTALLAALAVVHRRPSPRGSSGSLSLLSFSKLALLTLGLGLLVTAVRKCKPIDLVDLWSHHQTRLVALPVAFAAYSAALVALMRLPGLSGSGRRGRAVAAAVFLSLVSTLVAARLSLPETAAPPLPDFRSPRSASGPTMLLITLDTVRQDHLSCYGYARRTTPHIDAFAATAAVFENALASSPYTLSSHASLFTGRLPSDHGAHRVPYDTALARLVMDLSLPAREETLAQALLRRGYHTGAIVANAGYLGKWTGLQQGFEYYHVSRNSRVRHWPVSLALLLRLFPSLDPSAFVKESLFPASYITDAALEWFRASRGQASLLFLNYMEAHAPYRPPPPYDRRFHPEGASPSLWPRLYRPPDLKVLPDPEELRLQMAEYDGEIALLDTEAGRLLDGLEAAGLLGQMLVVITSDHGESFGEHGLVEHGFDVYDDVLRIPLIVKLPGQREGVRVSDLVALQDVRGMVEKVVDGSRSPSALLEGLRDTGPRIVAQQWISVRTHELYPDRFRSPYVQAIYDGRWKLIQRVRGPSELYDLQTDAAELHDLFRAEPSAAAAHEARLTMDLPSASNAPRGEVQGLSPEDLEGLRALGYIH